jgi:hypothetical protein
MRRLARFLLLWILCVCAVAPSQTQWDPFQSDQEHTEWIAAPLSEMRRIKVGMTRSDLMTVFRTEGGLSTTSHRTYVYRQCSYIKVDATCGFKA